MSHYPHTRALSLDLPLINSSIVPGLLLSLILYLIIISTRSYLHSLPSSIVNNHHPITPSCEPGEFNTDSQLPWSLWRHQSHLIPLYSTHDLQTHPHTPIEHVIVLQHGNLRHANVDYCTVYNQILELSPERYLIIAPQFLIYGDQIYSNQQWKSSVSDSIPHEIPIFTGRGWKDGSYNRNHLKSGRNISSYGIFRAILTHITNKTAFPNVKRITLFGFSAGAQFLQRFALLENNDFSKNDVSVQYLISNPSSFVYFNALRPTHDGTGFGIPNSSWLRNEWEINQSNNRSWISNWNQNCDHYNHWRFGLENFPGYVEEIFSKHEMSQFIENYGNENITYIMGTGDDCNCKLNPLKTHCFNEFGTCFDNDIATYCQGIANYFVISEFNN